MRTAIVQHKNGPKESVCFDNATGQIMWYCPVCGATNEKEYEAKSFNKDDYCSNCEQDKPIEMIMFHRVHPVLEE